MAITPNKYYPSQMNGPVISANGIAVNSRLADARAIEQYLYNLSIDTADETELENIGLIVGYPRPLVPEGFNEENLFIFTTVPMSTSLLTGFSTVGSEVGGKFTSVAPSESNYMSLELYRSMLKKVALIKRNGITLNSVDQIAKLITDDYTITWNSDKDIVLTFNTAIGYINVWILTQLFLRIATAPQVIIYSV